MKAYRFAAVAALGAALALGGCGSDEPAGSATQQETQQESQEETEQVVQQEVQEPARPEGMTASQEQAYEKAQQYLSVMAFSHDGLIKQLEFE